MRQFTFMIALAVLLFSSCKKSEPTTATPPITTIPYYFKFSLDGTNYNLNAFNPQYMAFNENEIGGYQVANNFDIYPGIGLRLRWPSNDTVTVADVMALVGKTLYFSDTTIHPELSFDTDFSSDTWYSEDTSNTSFNVKITQVSFLKNDTTIGIPVNTYVIKGTCNAFMSNSTKSSPLTGGEFNFIISRKDL